MWQLLDEVGLQPMAGFHKLFIQFLITNQKEDGMLRWMLA